MKKRSILSMLTLLCLATAASSSEATNEPYFFTGDIERVQALASNEGKLYFLYFSASWCMPCQWMEEKTFTDIQLKAYASENYLPVKIDIDEREGQMYRRNYQVKALPTIIIFNSQGEFLQKYEEALPAPKLLHILQSHDLAVNRLVVTIPLAPPNLEEIISKDAPMVEDSPDLSTLSAEPVPAFAKPVVNTRREYTSLPETDLSDSVEAQPNYIPSFSVQLGAFSQMENASRLLEQLQSEINVPLEIWPVQHDGQNLYKVIAGSFTNRSEAIKLFLQLKNRSIRSFVVVR